MRDIVDIIEYENENTSIDFKVIDYKKETFEAFLKDIMSLANAKTNDSKFILTGIKFKVNNEREIIGINENFTDDAIYQQLVYENIEPSIQFKFYYHDYKNLKIGVFEIVDSLDPPYMMKKDFGKLKRGDCFLRKGSHQTRCVRKDFDNFSSYKTIIEDLSKKVKLSFDTDDFDNVFAIKPVFEDLPSLKAERNIKSKIEHQKRIEGNQNSMRNYLYNLDTKSVNELENDLQEVKLKYKDSDNYHILEETANKIMLYILNDNDKYIEDGYVEIKIEKNKDFLIPSKIFLKPQMFGVHNLISPIASNNWESLNYPEVVLKNGIYTISQGVGNIKHKLPQEALNVPFRLVIFPNYEIQTLKFEIKLYAKNLQNPIEGELQIALT